MVMLCKHGLICWLWWGGWGGWARVCRQRTDQLVLEGGREEGSQFIWKKGRRFRPTSTRKYTIFGKLGAADSAQILRLPISRNTRSWVQIKSRPIRFVLSAGAIWERLQDFYFLDTLTGLCRTFLLLGLIDSSFLNPVV